MRASSRCASCCECNGARRAGAHRIAVRAGVQHRRPRAHGALESPEPGRAARRPAGARPHRISISIAITPRPMRRKCKRCCACCSEWDPLICADLHVTDGADFEPDISIQVEPINQGDPQLCASGVQTARRVDRRTCRRQGSLPLPFYPDLVDVDDPAAASSSRCIRRAFPPDTFRTAIATPCWSRRIPGSTMQRECASLATPSWDLQS